MSKHDAAPTHGWVISSQINKWLALAFMFVAVVVSIAVWTVTYSIRRDCQDVYDRTIKLGSYWLHVRSGSTAPDCPAP